jgi:hypothetical protein
MIPDRPLLVTLLLLVDRIPLHHPRRRDGVDPSIIQTAAL